MLLLLCLLVISFTACSQKAEVVVVAIVNGEEITEEALEDNLYKYIKSAEKQGYSFEGEEGERYKNDFRIQMLDEMIEFLLIQQAAKAEGIQVENNKIKEEMESIRESMGAEEFKRALEDGFLTESDIEEIIWQQLLIEELFDYVAKDVEISLEKMEDFYEQNKDYLVTMKVSHILIGAMNGEVTAAEKQQAYMDAQEIIRKLNAGADFAELAREYSADPGSAAEGGVIDYYFTKQDSNLVPEFITGSYILQEGEYSKKPIETVYGYHIILALDKRDTFEQLMDDIKRYIQMEEGNRIFEKYIHNLYEKAEIVNFLKE